MRVVGDLVLLVQCDRYRVVMPVTGMQERKKKDTEQRRCNGNEDCHAGQSRRLLDGTVAYSNGMCDGIVSPAGYWNVPLRTGG